MRTEDEWNASDDETESENSGNENDETPLENFYELDEQRERRIRRFGVTGYERDFRLINTDRCQNLGEILPRIIDRIIDTMIHNDDTSGSMIGASLSHPDLRDPILVPFRPRENVTGDTIMEIMNRVIQSNTSICLDDQKATLRLIKVTPPAGEGQGHHNQNRFFQHAEFLNRKCILRIKNNDSLCLARALVVAMARHNKNLDIRKWNAIRKGDTKGGKTQREQAKILMTKAGLNLHQGPCGIPELTALQHAVYPYQIKVFSKNKGYMLMFEGTFSIF